MGDLGAEGSPKDRRLTARALERLRRFCLSLPETNERESHGERGWFVRDRKLFVTFVDHHHDDRVGFWCAASPGDQAALVSAGPARLATVVGGRCAGRHGLSPGGMRFRHGECDIG